MKTTFANVFLIKNKSFKEKYDVLKLWKCLCRKYFNFCTRPNILAKYDYKILLAGFNYKNLFTKFSI